MAILWTEDLSVGVRMIDDEHKMLFKKADELFEAGKNGKAKDYISQLLDFLDEYTKKHFADEERYMQSISYPEYVNQKKMHTDFIKQISELKKDYQQSGGNISVIINANQIVIDWLLKHISREDKKIGLHAKKVK